MSELIYGVIGGGAIGGSLYSQLFLDDLNVHILLRSNYVSIKERGLSFENKQGSKHIILNPKIYNDIATMPICDVVFLTTKTYSNNEILPKLASILKPETIIIVMQNGLGIENEIAKYYSNQQIATVSWMKASHPSAASFRHDFGDSIQAAVFESKSENFSNTPTELVKLIIEDLKDSGVKLQLEKNFLDKRWTKLVLNIPFFILTIKYNKSSKEILNTREYRDELINLRDEIIKLASSQNYTIDEKQISEVDVSLSNAPTASYPSMKVDFDNGKEIELDIFEKLLNIGKQNGSSLPLFTSGYENIKNLLKKSENHVEDSTRNQLKL